MHKTFSFKNYKTIYTKSGMRILRGWPPEPPAQGDYPREGGSKEPPITASNK